MVWARLRKNRGEGTAGGLRYRGKINRAVQYASLKIRQCSVHEIMRSATCWAGVRHHFDDTCLALKMKKFFHQLVRVHLECRSPSPMDIHPRNGMSLGYLSKREHLLTVDT